MHIRLSRLHRALWAFLCLVALAMPAVAGAVTWTDVRSTVATRGITGNGHLYVSAAANGIWTSKDLKTWTHASLPGNAGLMYEDVIWDGSHFLAAGYGIVSSSDGVSWKVVYAPNGKELHGISKMGGVYVAVGDGNRILRSTDGETWHSVSSGVTPAAGDSVVFTGVATDGAQFVVAGEEYSGTTILNSVADLVVTSPDGQTWTTQSLPAAGTGFTFTDANDVAAGGGHYFVGGFVAGYSSLDSTTWNSADISGAIANANADTWVLNRVAYLNGQFLGIGVILPGSGGAERVGVFKSPDGITWSSHGLEDRGASFFGLAGLAFSNGTYLAAGYQGVYTSTDASHWTKPFTGPQAELWRCVITGGGRDIAFGQDGVLVTTDGSQWPESYVKVANQTASQGRGCGAYGAGVYVVAGSQLMWSTNGSKWTAASIGGVTTSTFGWHSVVWNGTSFVALSSAGTAVATSTDGKSWTSALTVVPAGTIALDSNAGSTGSLISAGQMLVAWGTIDGKPLIMTSTDGSSWSQATLNGADPTDTIASVASGGSGFAAIGNKADGRTLLLTSSDAKNWTKVSTSEDHVQWESLVFGDDQYMAAGTDTQRERGVVFAGTSDGTHWTAASLSDASVLNDLAWDGTQYIIAGSYDIEQGLPAGGGGSGGSGGGGGGGSGGGGGGGGSFGLLMLAILTGFGVQRRRG